jgi:hypothetical protein
MDLDEYRRRYQDTDIAPGWHAIDEHLESVYDGVEPLHWGTVVPYLLGGPDPLDGISAYPCEDGGINHLHFVTYGYSCLYYDEESIHGPYSQFGFEMTFRLASPLAPREEPMWVCDLLQNIAAQVFKTGQWLTVGQWMPLPQPLSPDGATDIAGLIFFLDLALGAMDSPHGRVEFLQAFGITPSELTSLQNRHRTPEEILDQHRVDNPLLVTDGNHRDTM